MKSSLIMYKCIRSKTDEQLLHVVPRPFVEEFDMPITVHLEQSIATRTRLTRMNNPGQAASGPVVSAARSARGQNSSEESRWGSNSELRAPTRENRFVRQASKTPSNL